MKKIWTPPFFKNFENSTSHLLNLNLPPSHQLNLSPPTQPATSQLEEGGGGVSNYAFAFEKLLLHFLYKMQIILTT